MSDHARPPDCIVATTTVATEAEADTLAQALIEARLAACVQTVPIRSLYRWKGAVEKETETLLTIKTRRSLRDALIAELRRRHPYEVPEILIMPVEGGLPAYLDWIMAETDADRE